MKNAEEGTYNQPYLQGGDTIERSKKFHQGRQWQTYTVDRVRHRGKRRDSLEQ